MRVIASVLAFSVAAIAATGAFAQQAKFDPQQCEQRSAGECNDLMASLGVPGEKREEVLMARARIRLQGHDLAGAIAEFREITTVNPSSPMVFANLGLLESIADRWPEAARDLRRALELDPNHGEVRPMLAVALARSGDCGAARDTLAAARKAPAMPGLDGAAADVGKACP